MPATGVLDASARRAELLPAAVLGLAAICVAGVLFVLGRGTIFFFDEWNFVLERRGGGVDVFLRGHNGHPSMLPVLVYRVLFAAVGLEHYGVFRLTVIAVHLACVALLYLLVRRRSGPWIALVIAAALLVLGRAWEDLLWPFQVGYLASVAGGIGAVLALDRRVYWQACVFTVLAIASSGLGASVIVAVIAELVVRKQWRHLWVGIGPGVALAAWTFIYGEGQLKLGNAGLVAGYTADAAAAVFAALTGLEDSRGQWVGGAAVAMAGVVVLRRRELPPGLTFGVAGAGSFWILTALARGELGSPTSSRYLYPGAVFVLIAVAALVPGRPRAASPWFGLGLLVVLFAGWQGLDEARGGARALQETSTIVGAELRGVEEVAPVVPADFRPDLQRMPQVFAGPYLAAVRDLGSPATPAALVDKLPQSVKQQADAVIAAAVMGQVTAPAPLPQRGCERIVGEVADLPPPGVVAGAGEGTVEVHLLRFRTSGAGSLLGVLQPGGATLIRPPTTAGRWRLGFRPPGAATLCAVP